MRTPAAVLETIEVLAGDPRLLSGEARVELVGRLEGMRGWLAAREADLLAVIGAERDDVDAGARDVAQLVQHQANVGFGEGRRRELRSVWLAEYPVLASALSAGRLGVVAVDELCALADRLPAENRSALDGAIDDLVRELEGRTPRQARRCLLEWEASLDDDGDERLRRQRRANAFTQTRNPDGTARLSGQLDPIAADELRRAIDTRVGQRWRAEAEDNHDAAVPNEVITNKARRAEALLDLVRAGSTALPGTTNRAGVIVVIDHQTLLGQLSLAPISRLTNGTPIPAAEARRLACDAGILPIVMGGPSLPLDVGRTARTATPAQRAALAVVHDTCCIDGCDVDFDHCEIHHIHWWRLGGPTDLTNLAPLCSRHHHLVHDHRWHLTLDTNRVGHLTYRTAPPPTTSGTRSAVGAPPTPVVSAASAPRSNAGRHPTSAPPSGRRVVHTPIGPPPEHQAPMRC